MEFFEMANSATMYLFSAVVLLFVTFTSVVFLIRAWREGVKIGMDKAVLKKAITSSATFTFVPSIGLLMGVIALAGSLGFPFSWLRLSVIGSIQYELMAAEMTAKAAGMTGLIASQMTPENFVAIAIVMTLGIICAPIFCIFFLKKYQNTVMKKIAGDGEGGPSFGPILFNAMFIGLVSAFVGAGFADLRIGHIASLTAVASSALFMAAFKWLIEKRNAAWLENFSLAFSMLLGMGSAVVLNLFGIN